MSNIQFIQVTPEQLQNAIIQGVKTQLDELKKHFQPKEPTEFLTRNETASWLKINLSTLHNYTKQGKLIAHSLSGRVYYKRDEVLTAIVKLKK